LKADLSAVKAEAVALLQSLIRFNTTNPPGNELPLARFIHEKFSGEGIESRLLTPAENRGAVVARIPGDGRARPVLLLAHMDVVGVEPDKWSCDPFAGVIRDGYVYGRGAFDDKGMLAANMMTMLLIQRGLSDSKKLSRDVVFVRTGLNKIIEHLFFVLQFRRQMDQGLELSKSQTSSDLGRLGSVQMRGNSGSCDL